MKDDMIERLRTVDPATDERILQEARALADVPGRVTSGETTNARRLPRAVRRRATLAAVAAVVAVAIALPLTLLRSLGDGNGSAAGSPGTWVDVGRLVDLRSRGTVYVSQINAFVLVPAEGDPYALWAATGSSLLVDAAGRSPRALYCESAARFVDPDGDVFDRFGFYESGPVQRGLGRFPVRVTDGTVQVDVSRVTTVGVRDPSGAAMDPRDLGCLTANGVPLEGAPGFAIANGTDLPPIAVALPQTGAFVQSPVLITGSANVFEATVSIRVLDANGDVIAEAFTTAACGTGCRGDFSTQVEVPIGAEQPGTILVFESSAQDGSMINAVEIPVTLEPGLAAADPSVEGIWYDGDGASLPNGSAGSEGTAIAVLAGPEHCQWESATFMHLAWPVGTIATSFDDERQYVRDPEGLFDDGALRVGFMRDITLPADAVETGFHRGPWQLWVSPTQADDAVFVVDEDTGIAERWGRSSEPILCM